MKKGRDALNMTDMALKKNETNMIDEKKLNLSANSEFRFFIKIKLDEF